MRLFSTIEAEWRRAASFAHERRVGELLQATERVIPTKSCTFPNKRSHVSRRRSSQHINTHLSHEAEARGEVEPGPEGHVAEVRLKPPPRVEDDGGGAMLPSLGTRLPKHGSASVLRGSWLRCTGE